MPECIVKLKRLHEAQDSILKNRKRFNVIKCGRRFGKTELAQELVSETVFDSKKCAYFSPTYKDLHEVWMSCKNIFHDVISGKDENVKQIRFITGSKVDFWSMEDPDSGRGRSYHRIIIDECEKAGKFKEAWQQTIRATLSDFEGDGYFLSTPQLGATYFKEMAKLKESYPDWETFVFPTSSNPYISKDEIEQARLLLPDAIFRSEYLAQDVLGLALNPFFHQYKPDKHENKIAVFDPRKQIVMHIDFNLTPFAIGFSHIWQDSNGWHDHQFDEMEIVNGSIPAMVDAIKDKYRAFIQSALLTGDAMGKRGDLSQRDNSSFYTQLLRGLGMSTSQLKVAGNPTHVNSKADCNYFLLHFPDAKINPFSCPKTIAEMRSLQCDATGAIIKKDRKDLTQRGDFADGFRYKVNSFHRSWITNHQKLNNYLLKGVLN